MKTGILFDLDGTLWDSVKPVVDSWNIIIDTLPDFHKRITNEDMMGLMGKTMDDIAYTYFNTLEKKRALEVMEQCLIFENEYISKTGGNLYPHLEEVLEDLSKDYELAVVSNCQKGYIEAFAGYHGLEKYFKDTECFGGTGLPKAENISLVVSRMKLDRAVYVGDTLGDYNSAVKAGVPFILADYGFGEVPGAEYRIESLTELRDVISRIKWPE